MSCRSVYLFEPVIWRSDCFVEPPEVNHYKKIDEVLVSKREAYIGPPEQHARTDGKAGEVCVLASLSFVHEDVSGPA